MTWGQENRIKDFYVVFQGAKEARFWDSWTDKGFRHCWAFHPVDFPAPGLMADQYCLKVEVAAKRIDTNCWWAPPDNVIEHFLKAGVTDILRVRVDIGGNSRYIPRGLLTCVSATKSLLGLRAWWVLSPLQLYAHLIRHGATSVRN